MLELAERAWRGELEGTQVHPGNALVAFEELSPRLGFLSAFSNVAALATDDGLVLLDTSSLFHAQRLFEEVRRWTPARVHTAVYSHGHVDHVFGLAAFEREAEAQGWPRVRVLAHERCPARFEPCARLEPEDVPAGPGRRVACFLHDPRHAPARAAGGSA